MPLDAEEQDEIPDNAQLAGDHLHDVETRAPQAFGEQEFANLQQNVSSGHRDKFIYCVMTCLVCSRTEDGMKRPSSL